MSLETWTDHTGRVRPVPGGRGPLQFGTAARRAFRLFLYTRDDFRCTECRVQFIVPDGYDGGSVLRGRLGTRVIYLAIDHITPRCAGGDNRPSNLRSLCSPCNSRKAYEDFRLGVTVGLWPYDWRQFE